MNISQTCTVSWNIVLEPAELMHTLFSAADPTRTQRSKHLNNERKWYDRRYKKRASDENPLGLSVWFAFSSHQWGYSQ